MSMEAQEIHVSYTSKDNMYIRIQIQIILFRTVLLHNILYSVAFM